MKNGKNLWAPWRMQYMESLAEDAAQTDKMADKKGDESCFLADYWSNPQDDEQNLIVFRNASGLILLNRYPYSNGHLLVALGEGRPRLLDYEPDQRTAFWQLIERATDLMEITLNPQGINIGINQGKAAGAGLPHHLHAHIVPRWLGDTNFITTVGSIRVIPDSLTAMYKKYNS